MTTVIISLYESCPPRFGTATITFNVAKYMPGKKILIQVGRHHSVQNLDDSTQVITLRLASENRLLKFLGLLSIYHRIVVETRTIDPDVVIIEGGSWSLYQLFVLKTLRCSRITSKIVYHIHNVEYELRRQKENMLICEITRWAEKKALKESDFSVSVSERDSDYFRRLYGIRPYVLPTSVDVDKFSCVEAHRIREIRKTYGMGDNSILFIGSVGYKPNDEAIRLLIDDIMPAVVKKIKDAQLVILGGNVSCREKYLINPGAIPHDLIPSFIYACDLCVAPIISGSGTRLKILEYLACGKAVVSTSKGAEGIELRNGLDIILADDLDNLAQKIVELLKNRRERARIGRSGKEIIEKKYSWKANLEAFARTLQAKGYFKSDKKNI